MSKKIVNLFLLDALALTFCMFWLSHGPHFEGLNQYTALSFLSGLFSGVMWGLYLFAWISLEIQRALESIKQIPKGQ